MSFKALVAIGHVHSLSDDLESFIYVVLYAALRWLPVESSIPLCWWISDFFGAPRTNGRGGGANHKLGNAYHRMTTSDICSTTSSHVVGWLNTAMDLHYKGGVPNPVWSDGKELRKMWEEVLAAELPSNDRVVKQIPSLKTRNDGPHYATYTSVTSMEDLYRSRTIEPTQPPAPTPAKQPRADSEDNSVLPPAPNPSKRPRIAGGGHTRGRGQRETAETRIR